MTDYLTDFVQESDERITELNNALLTLEGDPTDAEAMENIFRIAHTLKGNCGAMGFTAASDLAHALEDLLDAVRSGELDVTAELMDVIFDAVDELETMIDEVEADGEIGTDPSATIDELRARLEAADGSISFPTTAEIDAVLERFDPPTADEHDAYLVRLDIAEREDVNNGALVIEALVDAFDLIGTDPPRTAIEAGDYDGQYDAVFASAVGKAAIESGLEPVGEVDDFELVDVTDRFAAAADGDDAPAAGAETMTTEDAADLEVDDLLDEFDEFDDLDEQVEEIDDDELEPFEDMGEAGSFDDLLEEDDLEVEPGEPAVDVTDEAADDAPASAEGDEATDDVEDANAVFNELKDEVEMVGFDELQSELEELEFDEFDSDEEVDMDELLGDDVEDVDDEPFLAEAESADDVVAESDEVDDVVAESDEVQPPDDTVGVERDESRDPSEPGPEDAVADTPVEPADLEESDAAELEEGTALDDDPEPADDLEEEAAGGELGVDADADAFDESVDAEPAAIDEDEDETADALEADDDGPQAAFGEADDEGPQAGFDEADETLDAEPADAFDEVGDDDPFADDSIDDALEFGPADDAFDEVEDDDPFADVEDDGTATGLDDVLEDDTLEGSFGEGAVADDGIADDVDTASAGSPDTDAGSFGDDEDGDEDDLVRRVDEPTLGSPDLSLPETEERPDADQQTDEIQSVRVDVEQVDSLLTLVEGLVTTRVRLRHAVTEHENDDALETELDELEGLTTDLQETVMDIRLVPLRTVASRLPRVVRDVARDQNKEVTFEMTGEDVEIDRSILDRIGDPLIHLVRNAVDHGIEPPAERERAEKPAEGSVEVHADRSRDRVTITVTDDGGGLDPDRLRSEAVAADILTDEEAADLSDDEAYDLIFHPGLSTAEEVTDVSGRGVGMDVVKRTVEDLDGTVEIDSTVGEGTTTTMTLPVSVAIDDILFVESGGEEFGVPTKAVEDIEPAERIETVDGTPVLTDGDDAYSVIQLDDALGTPRRGANGDGMVVRIRDEVRPVALHCDDVHGQQEVVVKPFEGFMSDIPGLSGATVRGRGDVVNILDVMTL